MKHICRMLVLLLMLLPATVARADTGEGDAAVRDGINGWMAALDWSGLEAVLSALPDGIRDVWDGAGMRETAGRLALPEPETSDPQGVFRTVGAFMRGALDTEWRSLAGTAATLLGLLVAGAFSRTLGGGSAHGVQEAAAFVCRCFTLTVVLSVFTEGARAAGTCAERLSTCMELAAPLLTALMTAMGAVATGGVLQPAMALLTEGVANAMKTVVVPLALCGGILGLFDQLTEKARLGELSACVRDGIKWTIGIVTTLYAAITALTGMTAAARDGVTLRTAKYAAGSLLPSVSGLVSGSFDTVVGCAGIVKNAAGVTVMLLIVSVAAAPLLKIAASMLLLRLTGAVTEPIAEKQQTGMLKAGASMLSVLLAACAAAAGMFLVTAGLVVALGNAGFAG